MLHYLEILKNSLSGKKMFVAYGYNCELSELDGYIWT